MSGACGVGDGVVGSGARGGVLVVWYWVGKFGRQAVLSPAVAAFPCLVAARVLSACAVSRPLLFHALLPLTFRLLFLLLQLGYVCVLCVPFLLSLM